MSKFIPQRKNANKHTQRGLKELENSIQRDGWIGAVTVAADGETFDGSARIETLANVMPDAAPIVIDVDGNTPVIVRRTDIPNADDPRAKRLAVAANRIAQIDLDWSAEVLAEIAQQEGDLLKGLFNDDELAELIGQGETKEETTDAGELVDKAAELQKKWQVQRGDVWEIGRHRLMCGDSTSAEDVQTLMNGERAKLVFTSPPYGINLDYEKGNSLDDLVNLIDRFAAMCDSICDEYAFVNFADIFPPKSQGFVSISQYYFESFRVRKWNLRANRIWLKPFGRLSLSYATGTTMNLREWEYLWVFRKGTGQEKLREHGKTVRGVWKTFGDDAIIPDWKQYDETTEKSTHQAAFPVVLPIVGIQCYSDAGDIVLEPFNGSGTTLVACERLDRIGRAFEILPEYCAVTLERMSLLGLAPKRIN